jgi:hypothetical protein
MMKAVMILVLVLAAIPRLSLAAAEEPVNPFAPTAQPTVEPNGYLVLSDGSKLEGRISITPGMLLRIYDRAKKEHVDIALDEIAQIDVEIEKQWLDREWRWKEAGSIEKVYTDEFYYNHKYLSTLTLRDGTKIQGDLNAVLYFENAAGKRKFFLRKFLTGPHGPQQAVPEIVFVRQVVLQQEAKEAEP